MKQPFADRSLLTASRPLSDRATASFLALLLFGIYLLSFNGRITSSDGLAMFAVTESVVKRGDLTTDQMWTFFGTKSIAAPDGEVYSKYGYGASLFALPFYALAFYLPFSGLMQVTLLSSAVAVALTAALVYLALRRLSFSPLIAVTSALLFGLATPAWVYAKEFWSEPFTALTLFAAFYFLLCYRSRPSDRDALLAGFWLGLAIAVRTTNVLLVPLYAVYAFGLTSTNHAPQNRAPRIQTRRLLVFFVPILLFILSVLLYNWIRFQNPLTTGYRPDETFSNNILLGAYGLLFSPGKGLFVYAPFLAALPFGVWQFKKRFRPELGLILFLFATYLILFSAWYYWWGGTNWAARFLVPTLPFLALLCAPLVELLLALNTLRSPSRLASLPFTPHASRVTSPVHSLQSPVSGLWSRVLLLIFLALVLLSVLNELAGVTVNSLTYRLRALNLSPNADWDTIFSPALSPLIGHWQTLKPTNLDVAWVRATPDAIQVDWLAVGLVLFFILCCAERLVRALSRDRIRLQSILWVTVLAALVTVSVLIRAADDPRLASSPGYAALLQTLQQQSNPRDVLVLNDDANARYFFNANRARVKWYGLARDPARWDEITQRVMASRLEQTPRVWFAYDDTVDAPNPMRDWFKANGDLLQSLEFGDGVHLVLYSAR